MYKKTNLIKNLGNFRLKFKNKLIKYDKYLFIKLKEWAQLKTIR